MTGQTADISNLCEYKWFQWVMYYDPPSSFPDNKMLFGRYLGPATDMGTAMTYKILRPDGNYVCRQTVRSWTMEEEACPALLKEREAFMVKARSNLGPASSEQDFEPDDLTPEFDYYADDDEDGFEGTPDEILPPTPEASDNYVDAQLMLPRGDTMAQGRVVKRRRDNDGNVVGRANANPILDTREYIVEFEDGAQAELTANAIAQNMYAQCDPEGNKYVLLDSLVDFRRSKSALTHADQKVTKQNGRTFLRRSTVGWQLCAQWKDGSTSWEKLSDLKESHPVETAEYAMSQGLEFEPAFNWWVPHVLKKREMIISLVRKREARYLKRKEKFGIAFPETVEEAYALDRKNGNTFWADAISKEMKNVKIDTKVINS